MKSKALFSYGWILPLTVGVLSVLFGLIMSVSGEPLPGPAFEAITEISWENLQVESNGMAKYISVLLVSEGLSSFISGIFLVFVSAVPFRRGEKWAWYLLWINAGVIGIRSYMVANTGFDGWIFILGFFIVCVIGQILMIKKVF